MMPTLLALGLSLPALAFSILMEPRSTAGTRNLPDGVPEVAPNATLTVPRTALHCSGVSATVAGPIQAPG